MMMNIKNNKSDSTKAGIFRHPALAVPAAVCIAIFLFITACEKEDFGKLQGNPADPTAVDVSSRVTGFDPDVTGAGATVKAVGSNLEGVRMVFMDGYSSPSVSASGSSVEFMVPIQVGLGQKEVLFVFEGNERAKRVITVIPRPVISLISPPAGYAGEEIVVLGTNLNYVERVTLAGEEATVTQREADILAFTVPAGSATGSPFILESPAGSVTSAGTFIQCEDNQSYIYCVTPANTNHSFEDGETGEVPGVSVPGWGFSGAGALATIEVVNFRNGEVRDKRQGLKVHVNDVGANPWNIEVREETFSVQPSTAYTYQIQAKGPVNTRVDFTIGRPNFSELGRFQATMTGNWEVYTIEFITGPEDNLIRTPIHFSRAVNIGQTFFLDDMRIVPSGGEVPCTWELNPGCFCGENPDDPRCLPDPINVNGGLEDGDIGTHPDTPIPSWGFSGSGPLATIEVTDEEVKFGDKALKVTVNDVGANPWNIELRQEGIDITPGQTYIYSIWVKGVSGQVDFTVGNPQFQEFGRVGHTTFNEEWQNISFEFTPGAEDVLLRTPIHLSRQVNVGFTFYFDELRIWPKE